MNKYFFILAGVLLLAAGCQQAVKTSSNDNKSNELKQAVKPKSDQPIPQGEKTGWQTYANGQYGFEIKYPNNFVLYTDAGKVKPLSYIPVCDDDMVACLSYSKDNHKNTNFEGAGVSVGVLKDSGTEANCLMEREGEGKTGAIAINGVNFAIYKGGGAAAGHSEQYWNYRAFKNNYCYQITLRTTEANISNFDPSLGVKEYNWNEVRSKQEQVLSTFKFTAEGQMTVKVYFSNYKMQKDPNSCSELFSLTREIGATSAVASAAVGELLKGPSVEEKVLGYSTGLPSGSKLNSLKIVNGVAYADFNQSTNNTGGSCNPLAQQIRDTLLQFPNVKSVKLSIDGKTEGIFQP